MKEYFLSEAIREVYKKSLIEEDDDLTDFTRLVLDQSDLSVSQKKELEKDLDQMDNKYKVKEYVCYIDGAVDSQSEEARAGAAFVVYLNEDCFYKYHHKLPSTYTVGGTTQKTSSHIAEYEALLSLLRVLKERILTPRQARLTIKTDSEVLHGQFYAEYRVTNEIQKELRRKVFELTDHFKSVDLEWIPREDNQLANDLAQSVLNE